MRRNDQYTDDGIDNENMQQQQYQQRMMMEAMSRKRTACLVLSRYHSNQFSDKIQAVIQNLTPELQQVYINKIYATAIEKCEPIIQQDEVMEFFQQNDHFSPEKMFYIFDHFDYEGVANNLSEQLTQNQQNILKFIKNFDAEMEIKKQEKQAQNLQGSADDDGVSIFFIPVNFLSSQAKYLYIVIVCLICGGALIWGFGQIGSGDRRPQKKSNKRRKKHE